MRRRPRGGTGVVLIGIIAASLLCGTAQAHDIGVMLVTVNLAPGLTTTPTLIVVADPDHLSADLRSPLAFQERFVRDCEIMLDGHRVVLEPLEDPQRAWVDVDGQTLSPHESPPRFVLKWTLPGGLTAGNLTFRTAMPVGQFLLRVRDCEGEVRGEWLEPGQISRAFALCASVGSINPVRPTPAPQPTLATTLWTYLQLGFTHIIPKGTDHILFVLGVFLLGGGTRAILARVTVFTIAHSITLALTMYRLVAVPASIVEPIIAISIVALSFEVLIAAKYGQSSKLRALGMVCVFGLIHGMGFAGVLAQTGLPAKQFLPALAGFNVGVEVGQLCVIATAAAIVCPWLNKQSWYQSRVVLPGAISIGLVGLSWTIDRLS